VRFGLIQARQAHRLESSAGAASRTTLSTLGVALYRAGAYAEAVDVLTKSLETAQGDEVKDLLFRAMALHCLGDPEAARADFDRAAQLIESRPRPSSGAELLDFHAEAEELLCGPPGELLVPRNADSLAPHPGDCESDRPDLPCRIGDGS
jgi:tetratricopeptide (TPR) repeat protein